MIRKPHHQLNYDKGDRRIKQAACRAKLNELGYSCLYRRETLLNPLKRLQWI